ncbi:MAG: selenocysteine-specific translation elongation factor [Chloroflexota bacterium]
MYVLGTAGHVDHGKSALVNALTGIDPDRLPEEKERQMTIDLGFAWFKLPDGREVSVVDVPGHEDFIRNMLAGVVGIDVALLIIAADEGVMPQTREHLAILDLLRVERGIVVITKKDLVDEEVLELATMEAEDVIKDTTLSRSPIIAVSAFSGEGIPELADEISRLLDRTTQRKDIGRPRLPIDRIFTIKGFGTVVTGTLIDGKLEAGKEIEIVPSGLKAAIRRLETHKQTEDVAAPGSRVSANLAGIPPDKLERGMVITSPGWLQPSQLLDVKLKAVADLPHTRTHDLSVMLYVGTSEVGAGVRLLDKEKLDAGDTGWAQLKLERGVAVAKGDLFVIRSPRETIGGGEIVDTQPKRHRRLEATIIQNLEAREKGTPEEMLLAILETSGPSEFADLVRISLLDETAVKKAFDSLVNDKKVAPIGHEGAHHLFFSSKQWENLSQEASELLQNYHTQFPLRQGMPREEIKSRLKISAAHADSIIKKLAEEGSLLEEGKFVRQPAHTVRPSPEQQSQAAAFISQVSQNPFPPTTGWNTDPEIINMLVQEGRVIRVREGFLTDSSFEDVVRKVTREIKSRGKITVSDMRVLFKTSRENAIALVQYLDEKKITLRVGSDRVLRE